MAVLDPTELRVRSRRPLAGLRWSTLGITFALAVITPLLHGRNNAALVGESAALPASAPGSVWLDAAARHAGTGEPPLVGAPWTVEVLGLEIMDPLAGAALAAAGTLTGRAALGLVPTLLLVALLGRFFCGWLCPYSLVASAADRVRRVLRRLGVPLFDVRLPAWSAFVVLGALLAVGAALGLQLTALVYPPSVLHRAFYKGVIEGSFGVGALVVAGAFLFDATVSRAGFCRSLCPGGAMFRLIGAFSPVGVQLTPEKCTRCTACDIVCPMGQSPMNALHDSGCDRCGRCVTACPTAALDLVAIQRKVRPAEPRR